MARYGEVLPAVTNNDLFAFRNPSENAPGFRHVRFHTYLEVAEHLNLFPFIREGPQVAHGLVYPSRCRRTYSPKKQTETG